MKVQKIRLENRDLLNRTTPESLMSNSMESRILYQRHVKVLLKRLYLLLGPDVSGKPVKLRFKPDVVIRKTGEEYILKYKTQRKSLPFDSGLLNRGIWKSKKFITFIKSQMSFIPSSENESNKTHEHLNYKKIQNRYLRVSGDFSHLLFALKNGVFLKGILSKTPPGNAHMTLRCINMFAAMRLFDCQSVNLPELRPRVFLQKKKKKMPIFSRLRITLFNFDPDSLLNYLYNTFKLKFVFKLPVLILAALLSLSILVIMSLKGFFSYTPQLHEQGIVLIPVFYAFLVISVIVHEIGHGLACKHWKGEVRNIGLRMLLFWPVGYTEVTDICLFSERYKRVFVYLAGPLTTFFTGIIWGSLWLFAEEGSSLKIISYELGFILIMLPLIYLNPYSNSRSDGSNIFSEIFGEMIFRTQSIKGYIKILFKGVKNNVSSENKIDKTHFLYSLTGMILKGFNLLVVFIIIRKIFFSYFLT